MAEAAKNKPLKEKPVQSKQPKKETASTDKQLGNPWNVLVYPHLAEKSTSMVEPHNTLVFMVNKKSTKADIKQAVETGFNVSVRKVTTLITQTGGKKAYIRLDPKDSAINITTSLGMV